MVGLWEALQVSQDLLPGDPDALIWVLTDGQMSCGCSWDLCCWMRSMMRWHAAGPLERSPAVWGMNPYGVDHWVLLRFVVVVVLAFLGWE